MSENIEEPANY